MDACFWESTLRCLIPLEMTRIMCVENVEEYLPSLQQMNIVFSLAMAHHSELWVCTVTCDPWLLILAPAYRHCPTPLSLYIENIKKW